MADESVKAQVIGIVGLDRVGASIGLALKRSSGDLQVIGHDRYPDLAQAARQQGAIDEIEDNLVSTASRADILVLVSSISSLRETLSDIGGGLKPHALLLDLSTLKGPGLEWAGQYITNGHYVGAMPVLSAVALEEGATVAEAASADLFDNSLFCLMPSAQANPQAVETAVTFGSLLGATPYFVDVHEYDNLVQSVETLPVLAAAALFRAVQATDGWRDILRFAGLTFARTTQSLQSGPDIAQLALNDREATLRWLDALMKEIADVRRLVEQGDSEVLTAVLDELVRQRARWLHERSENNWMEIKPSTVETRGIGEQFFGGFLTGRRGQG